MWSNFTYTIRQFAGRAPDAELHLTTGPQEPVVIRAARDTDLPALLDLAELDSAKPLTGPVLVAVIDGAPAAALALDGGRAIADPFRATAAAVALLRLRAEQLGAADRRPERAPLRRRIAGRARA